MIKQLVIPKQTPATISTSPITEALPQQSTIPLEDENQKNILVAF